MPHKKPRRRKCNRCGKYGEVAKDDMIHTGYGRVMYSEAHFAHRACLNEEKETTAAKFG